MARTTTVYRVQYMLVLRCAVCKIVQSRYRSFICTCTGCTSFPVSVSVCVWVQTIYRARSTADYKEKVKMDAASIMCQLDANNDQKLSMDEFVKAASTCPLVMDILKATNWTARQCLTWPSPSIRLTWSSAVEKLWKENCVVYAEAYVPSLKLKYAQVAIIRVNLMLDYWIRLAYGIPI